MTARNPFLPDFDAASPMPEALFSPHDLKSPQYLVANFLMGEIYLNVSNIAVFTAIVNKVQHGEISTWTWGGNVFALTIDRTACILTDIEAGPNEEVLSSLTMSHAEFLNVLREWKSYVAKFPLATY